MQRNVKSSLTDEAAEFARSMEFLLDINYDGNQPTHLVLQTAINGATEASLLDVYRFLYSRANSIYHFMQDIDDDFIDDDLRQVSLDAAMQLRSAFLPAQMGNPWPHVISNCIRKTDIQSIKFISRTMREY